MKKKTWKRMESEKMENLEEKGHEHLGSDAPKKNPTEDAFGYAEFAKGLANTVVNTPSPHGFVIGINGPWGSGKSSILNFVQFYLAEQPKNERPMVIEFNPWWFSNSDQLANQLLSRFGEMIFHESPSLLKLGELITQYAGQLGSIVGSAAGAPPWLMEALFSRLKKDEKSIPELKEEIVSYLEKSSQRFLFIIDDVDRLSPKEITELVKVVKALADFPQVIYILAYDRVVIADALAKNLQTDGSAFLEKIIQVEFPLPMVPNRYLQREFFKELDILLNSFPNTVFDAIYWRRMFYGNLDSYIKKPRDVVRVMNSLRGTYPMVAGEVNSVDYIALTIIRMFEPGLYTTLQSNITMFAKDSIHNFEQQQFNEFHQNWLESIPQNRQKSVKQLIGGMFPLVAQVWQTYSSGSVHHQEARKSLRICCPEVVHTYFELRVTDLEASQQGLQKLISLSNDHTNLTKHLLTAADHKLEDQTSLANFYIVRIKDKIDDFTEDGAINFLHFLAEYGDTILSDEDEDDNSLFRIPNSWKIQWLFLELLGRLELETRQRVLNELLTHGNAFGTLVFIVHDLIRPPEETSFAREPAFEGLSENAILEFKRMLINRLDKTSLQNLVCQPKLAFILTKWLEWTDGQTVRAKIQNIVKDPKMLPVFLKAWLSMSLRSTSDRSWKIHSLNPNILKDFLDLEALESLVIEMLKRKDLTEMQTAAGSYFLKGMKLIKEGKDPNRSWDEDEI